MVFSWVSEIVMLVRYCPMLNCKCQLASLIGIPYVQYSVCIASIIIYLIEPQRVHQAPLHLFCLTKAIKFVGHRCEGMYCMPLMVGNPNVRAWKSLDECLPILDWNRNKNKNRRQYTPMLHELFVSQAISRYKNFVSSLMMSGCN